MCVRHLYCNGSCSNTMHTRIRRALRRSHAPILLHGIGLLQYQREVKQQIHEALRKCRVLNKDAIQCADRILGYYVTPHFEDSPKRRMLTRLHEWITRMDASSRIGVHLKNIQHVTKWMSMMLHPRKFNVVANDDTSFQYAVRIVHRMAPSLKTCHLTLRRVETYLMQMTVRELADALHIDMTNKTNDALTIMTRAQRHIKQREKRDSNNTKRRVRVRTTTSSSATNVVKRRKKKQFVDLTGASSPHPRG